MSYSVLTHVFAKMCGMKPRELIMCLGDTHIYKNHVDQVKQQLMRTPYPFPTLNLNESVATKRIDELDINDFELVGYQYHPAIKAIMAV
jgi:thymidylate synthase